VSAPIRIPVLQGSPEWLAARRGLVTATDIPILLGLSPYRCEADLAEEKLGLAEPQESTLRMQIGSALEDLIAHAYASKTGIATRRVRGLWRSSAIEWAGASPDATAKGRLVELKWSGSRSRFGDEVPQDIEAQAAWQMLVADAPVCDVATLTVGDDDVRIYTVERNAAQERGLVVIAADFRARLAAGGPFAESNESLKRRYPRDNGAEMVADAEISAVVRHLTALREQRRELERAEEGDEATIKARMGEVAILRGQGFHVTWKRTKDSETIDWKALAGSLMAPMPETERVAFVGPFVTVRPGFRPLRVTLDKEDAS
jgi:putative phage-type endonuclease